MVEVKVVSINPVDYKVRSNEDGLNMIYGTDHPAILGWDIAGPVVPWAIKSLNLTRVIMFSAR
ncbi:MAG: hypothetical protein DWQ05_09150 [Calditrichaeota bacterium]|nr:MAG: hypothetical protein DWQ05_09150 [Calditrichota bacterium]